MFKVDFYDDAVVEWHRTEDGVTTRRDDEYEPALFVAAERPKLADLRARLDADPKVVGTTFEERYASLRADERELVLRADLARVDEVRTLAREIRGVHERGEYPPGTFRLFDVDLSPQFRYCIDTDTDPATPEDVDLRTLELGTTRKRLADRDVSRLTVDGDFLRATEDVILEVVERRLADADPDVLVVSHGELLALLAEKADEHGREEFALGRRPERETGGADTDGIGTAGSHVRVGRSPGGYDVSGRAVVDTSNSFLWGQAGLAGLEYLVSRSWQPIQEVGRASIGTVLTAVQIREARDRDVLIPWNKWEPEAFKDVRTLHAADRGGFTFSPEVGLHEGVYEVDFASLYPNVICRYNVSPDTVCCACHADREDVPELGYSVCDDRGFLPDVLQPLLDDRARMKREAREIDDPDRVADLRRTASAIKWILVSCFGYQGYRNAKFGRIECHEAINAVARDVLLRAKEAFEAEGWRVVHGIVDSLWVTPVEDRNPTPLSAVTEAVTADVGVRLEHEATYDWICFVPKRDSSAGALNRYFGKVRDADEYKVRGIEARQRSTPAFVADAQRELLRAVDRHREPEPVCDALKRRLAELRTGDVPTEDLLVTTRASKRPEAYRRRTRTAAALDRAKAAGLDPQPGQSFDFVVVDDSARSRERVRLDFELDEETPYDVEFYEDRLIRAAESVVSPLGWDRARIRRYLRDVEEVRLSAFGDG